MTKSPNSAIVRAAGIAWKMKATAFLEECRETVLLSRLVHRYTHLLLTRLSSVGYLHPLSSDYQTPNLLIADDK